LRLLRGGGVADDARERLEAQFRGVFRAGEHRGGGAVGDARRAGGGDRAVLAERRAQGRDLADVGPARLLVGGELDLTLAGGHLDRNDLFIELTRFEIGKASYR